VTDKKAILAEISKLLEEISQQHIQTFDLKANIKDQLSLDSVQMVELFMRLETTFKVELPLSLMNAHSGEEFIQGIEQTIRSQA